MSALDFARWQFGVAAAAYHVLFAPIAIGITGFVALVQGRLYPSPQEVEGRR